MISIMTVSTTTAFFLLLLLLSQLTEHEFISISHEIFGTNKPHFMHSFPMLHQFSTPTTQDLNGRSLKLRSYIQGQPGQVTHLDFHLRRVLD